ncbi:oogenesis-related [Denticeps clupeoides]|uniref:Oogenesis-related gene n=1 Tax=Denticeps clupeoides TaxID=299321 RepID=A0AAY4DRZ1_9TELE|nr:uncharacterized protein LOC114802256 [Denticeps clupeoides]
MSSHSSYEIEPGTAGTQEGRTVAKRDSVFSIVLCRVSRLWPVRFTVYAFRGFWRLLRFSPERRAVGPPATVPPSPPARPWRSGRKRLWRATRLLLSVLPCRLQSALGYPVCSSIGRTVSPEVRCSPTKPHGKGSKRKQDDLDEDELEQQSWVEALTQELADEDNTVDPDYEPSSAGTDSEEYRSHNDTESDVEIEKGVVVIRDVDVVRLYLDGFYSSYILTLNLHLINSS